MIVGITAKRISGRILEQRKEAFSKVILTAKNTEKEQRNAKLIVSKSDIANSAKNLGDLCG